jgi:hypothetical protein
MQDIATPILVILLNLVVNPIIPILLICPFGFSVFYECIQKKFTTSDTIIATLSVFLLFSGLIFFLLGIGLTSPIFTTNVSATNTINTKIFFNDKNLPLLNSTDSLQIIGGIDSSNASVLAITTTLEPNPSTFNFGMLGLFIGVVSLGVSIILSAVSTILTIYKSYETSYLTYREYRNISVIWTIFGLFTLLYGYSISGFTSDLVKLFGIFYIDVGLFSLLIFSWLIRKELDFGQKIKLVIAQLNVRDQNKNELLSLLDWCREHLNTFISDKKTMESRKVQAWVVSTLGAVLTLYIGWTIVFNSGDFLKFLPLILVLEIGIGALTWGVVTLRNLPSESATPEAATQVAASSDVGTNH